MGGLETGTKNLLKPKIYCWFHKILGALISPIEDKCMYVQGVFFFWPPPNLTKSQALYNLNGPPLKFPKYRNL